MFADLFSPVPILPIDRVLGDLLRHLDRSTSATGTMFPLQVRRDGDAVVITAFAPGCRAEDLQVQVEDNEVTITGRRDVAVQDQQVIWHRRERTSSEWTRSIALPFGIDAEHTVAELHDGVLTLRLSRAATERPRTITVTPRPAGVPS